MNKHVNKVQKATGRAEAITAGRQQNKQYLIICSKVIAKSFLPRLFWTPCSSRNGSGKNVPFSKLSLPPDRAPIGSRPFGVKPFSCSTLSLSSLHNNNVHSRSLS